MCAHQNLRCASEGNLKTSSPSMSGVFFTPDLVKNQYVAYQGRTLFMAGIGYYFPQVKTWARRML